MATRQQQVDLGERVYELREQGRTWGQIASATGRRSGIPCREAMYVYLVETGRMPRIDPSDVESIIAARKADVGWAALAAQTRLSQNALRTLVGEHAPELADGRAYGRYGITAAGADAGRVVKDIAASEPPDSPGAESRYPPRRMAQLKLTLPDFAAAAIRERAVARGQTVSAYVQELVLASCDDAVHTRIQELERRLRALEHAANRQPHQDAF